MKQAPPCLVSRESAFGHPRFHLSCILTALCLLGPIALVEADNSDTFAFKVVEGFSAGPAIPEANVILSSDGLLYGTTSEGGANNSGTVFRMGTDGSQFETLVHFSYNGTENKGAAPLTVLTEWADMSMNQYFFGTTSEGGQNGNGTIFRMTPTGSLETLIDFTGTGGVYPGSRPEGELLLGNDGNLYGTTSYGGANDEGTVFRLSPTGTFTLLHEFDSADMTNNGAHPKSALTNTATTGVFVGTTSGGGDNGDGTVFQIDSYGSVTTLVHFSAYDASNPGAGPAGPLLRASDGNFYGTTQFGAKYDETYKDQGTVYKMTPAGVHTTIAAFVWPIPNDHRGLWPTGALVEGNDGWLYGTTYRGGLYDRGVVFRVGKSGGMENLVDFDFQSAPKGSGPTGHLIQIASNEFIGTTSAGGDFNKGTAFRVSNVMSSSATLTTVVNFTGQGAANETGPAVAAGGLTEGTNGYLYGTTGEGGLFNKGTVFRSTKAGVVEVLVEFTGNGMTEKGEMPVGELLEATDGNFYGVTSLGGTDDLGTIFRMSPTGTLTTLIEFTGTGGGQPGSYPSGGLTDGGDGYLYGITSHGGANDYGTVFRMTLAGAFESLVSLTGDNPGAPGFHPRGTLVKASDGDFYGTTETGGENSNGTIFKMTSGGAFTSLFEFPYLSSYPYGLTQGSDGHFYGVCEGSGFPLPFGGVTYYNYGNVFRYTSDGSYSVLANFYGDDENGTKGRYPMGRLLEGADGYFYGTTSAGGVPGYGTAFRCTNYGYLETIFEFTGTEGGFPGSIPNSGPLILDSEGDLYGITSYGGLTVEGKPAGHGQIFRLLDWQYVEPPPEPTQPLIQVRLGAKVLSSGGGAVNFKTVKVRRSRSKTFTIENVGTDTLAGLSTKVTGKHKRDFKATRPTAGSLAVGRTATFRVKFKPRDIRTRKANLYVRSNAANGGNFLIKLKGRGK